MFGPERGDELADDYAQALGRTLDAAVFHGTTQPIQENQMNERQITEVSATVDAGLSQDDLEGMNEAERLALIVGSAYGQALAERDQAREQRDALVNDLVQARRLLEQVQAIQAIPDAYYTARNAYGRALVERDEAREVTAKALEVLTDALVERDEAREVTAKALEVLTDLLDAFPATSFAQSTHAVDRAREFVQGIGTVDSTQTPTPED